MKNVVVIGAGMVGTAMAIDLAAKHKVTLADKSEANLKAAKTKCATLSIQRLDVTDLNSLKNTLTPFDIVVCAVPGFLGYKTLKAIIEAGKNVVDISFFPEDALALNELAKNKGVTAVVDCGVAPGLDNIILGYHNTQMKVDTFECLVGGLPKEKQWPFNYKAPFSPIDVFEEYTRPARYVENGKVVVRPPLTDVELIDFPKIGTLEAFNSDGLRSLIHTMPHIPNMKEKTLRYPGHAEYISVLAKSGFFSTEKIKVGDAEISPIAFTGKLLFDAWKLGKEEEELTLMRVRLTAISGKKVEYLLHDTYCPETKTSSMARTTGYTATSVVNLLLDKKFGNTGIIPPEIIGADKDRFDYILNYLKARNIELTTSR